MYQIRILIFWIFLTVCFNAKSQNDSIQNDTTQTEVLSQNNPDLKTTNTEIKKDCKVETTEIIDKEYDYLPLIISLLGTLIIVITNFYNNKQTRKIMNSQLGLNATIFAKEKEFKKASMAPVLHVHSNGRFKSELVMKNYGGGTAVIKKSHSRKMVNLPTVFQNSLI